MKYGEEAVCALLDLLNEHEIPYMLVGSFSSNAYGEARSTKDADFLDAQGILKVRAEKLDWPYIEQWCAKLGLMDILEKLRKSI